jgi:hypothetical protein
VNFVTKASASLGTIQPERVPCVLTYGSDGATAAGGLMAIAAQNPLLRKKWASIAPRRTMTMAENSGYRLAHT